MSTSTNQTKFYYVSAPAGAGKTYSMCKYISFKYTSQKIIIASPHIKLVDQTNDQLHKFPIDPKSIYTITSDANNKKQSIRKHLEKAINEINKLGYGILNITWESFDDIRDILKDYTWVVFHDEIKHVDKPTDLLVPNNPNILHECLDFENQLSADTSSLKIKNTKFAEEYISRVEDQKDAVDKELIKQVLTGDYSVYTDIAQWNKIVVEKNITTTKKNYLYFISLQNPKYFEGFQSVTFMSAFIEKTLFWDWFNKHNVEFINHQYISKNLKFTQHENDHLVRVYKLQDQIQSKTNDNLKTDGLLNIKIIEKTIKLTLQQLGIEKIIYTKNNGSILKFAKGTEVSPLPHGLNNHQEKTGCVYLAALNRKNKERKMMNDIGFTNQQMMEDRLGMSVYQTLFRTSVRNTDNNNSVHLFVCGDELVNFLKEILPGLEICEITEKPLSRSERNKRDYLNRKSKSELK